VQLVYEVPPLVKEEMLQRVTSPGLGTLLNDIRLHHGEHSMTSEWHAVLKNWVSTSLLLDITSSMREEVPFSLGEIDDLHFPWLSFGSINSSHLFGLDELILFSFYWNNRHRYTNFLDLGANVGLHSLVTSRLGMKATAVEPDRWHLAHLLSIASKNSLAYHEVIAGAATVTRGPVSFLRVEGNSTGSHILGAKDNPYGDLTEIQIEGYPVTDLVKNKDLVKMDVEGLESDLLEALASTGFVDFDVLAEVGSRKNAASIFEVTRDTGVNIFCQKINWGKAEDQTELPHHHSEGSIFVSRSEVMPWC